MQTRKDLYQAHRLMTQRVALALLQGKPGAAESPLRRTGVGAFSGLMVVVLIAAGFGISGLLLKGGARNLDQPGVVIIEKETGATYAYSAQDRKLIPFLNYASARLAMSTTSIQRKLVSSKSLARYARGPMTGIQGAPESLPAPAPASRRSAGNRWSLCVRSTGSVGGVADSTVSLIGRDVGGRMLGDAEGVLVRGGAQTWLVWRNARMKVSPQAARVLTADQPVAVDQRWLNGLPQGPDFAAPRIPGRGRRFPGPNGAPTPAGQVFRVPAVAGTPERWLVQLPDGLAGISRTQAGLLLDAAGGGPGAPGPARDITPGAAGARPPSPTHLFSRGLPETPPRPVGYDPTAALCSVYRGTGRFSTDAHFTLGGVLPGGASAVGPATAGSGGLDQVVLSGGGVFAGTLAGPGQPPQSFALLTDQGIRYPIPTSDDVEKLGYAANNAVPVPANLLRLFREGPALTSADALRPVPAS